MPLPFATARTRYLACVNGAAFHLTGLIFSASTCERCCLLHVREYAAFNVARAACSMLRTHPPAWQRNSSRARALAVRAEAVCVWRVSVCLSRWVRVRRSMSE